jgi:hypothetical protein
MNPNRENEYLTQQAREAWAAMGNAFAQAGRAVHPRHWRARTRWLALGVTAAAGFVIASANCAHHHDVATAPQPSPEPKRHRISGVVKIIFELATLARPLLQSVLAGIVAHYSDEGAGESGKASSPPPSA